MKKSILTLVMLLCISPVSYAKKTVDQGTAVLSWTDPTTYNDGSVLPPTDIGGYKLYYGPSTGNYTNVIDIGPNDSNIFDLQLPSGIYFFTLTVYDKDGDESDKSNEASKDIKDIITIILPKQPSGLSCVQKIIN